MNLQAPALRRRAWERHGGLCAFCGQPVALDDMDLDHRVPKSQGGTDDEENLRPAHPSCNRRTGLNSCYVEKRYAPTRSFIQQTLRVDPETYARAKGAAQDAGISLNEWFNRAIADKAIREERGA